MCGKKLVKGKEIFEEVKVPEFRGLKKRPFCSEKCADNFKEYVTGTLRTRYCPSCGV
jgi:hypothetical protein